MTGTLQANTCRLIPLNASHAARYIELANDPSIRVRVENSIPYTHAHFEEKLSEVQSKPLHFCWMIEVSDSLVGVVTYASMAHAQRFQGGYWIDPAYWGRGIATDAVQRVVRFLFDACDAIRIQSLVDPDNAGSIAVLEKSGFIREALLRRFFPSKHYGLMDVVMYSIIRK